MADSKRTLPCITAVLAVTSADASAPPYVFRSDKNEPHTIAQVARATCAYPGIFPQVFLGSPPVSFVDAGIAGYNNPARIALDEARDIWPDKELLIFSIGTGTQAIIEATCKLGWEGLAEISRILLSNCEKVHEDLLRQISHDVGRWYFRLSVDARLEDVGVKDWKFNEKLAGITSGYLRKFGTQHVLKTCIRRMEGETLDVPRFYANLTLGKAANIIACRSLPACHPRPGIFNGRNDLVDKAVKLISETDGAHLALLGPVGIGKTSIARAILHDQRVATEFGDNRFFISCEGMACPALLVDSISLALGVPTNPLHRLDSLISSLHLKFTNQRLLVILDGCETLWKQSEAQKNDIKIHFEALRRLRPLNLVLTMRGSTFPDGIDWAPFPLVTSLVPTDAYITYCDLREVDDTFRPADDLSLINLLSAVDHNPLAITLMASLGRNGVGSDRLLGKWDARTLHGEVDLRIRKIVERSIRISLDSEALRTNPEALMLLRLVSVLPASVPYRHISFIASPVRDLDAALGTLEEFGLAYFDNTNALCVPSAIKSYILDHHFPSYEMLEAVMRFFAELSELRKQEFDEGNLLVASVEFGQIEINMEAILLVALSQHPDKLSMETALNYAYLLCGTRARETVIKQAVIAAYTPGLKEYLPRCLLQLGCIYQKLGRDSEAHDLFMEARAKFEAAGDQGRTAQCLRCLGDIDRVSGRYPEAFRTLAEARTKFKRVGDRREAARSLRSLGETHMACGNDAEARKTFTAAAAELEGAGDRLELAQCLQSLGHVNRKLSRYDEARCLFTLAKAKFHSIGEFSGAAHCLNNLGDFERSLSRFDEARTALSEARTLFNDIGDLKSAESCLQSIRGIDQRIEADLNGFGGISPKPTISP